MISLFLLGAFIGCSTCIILDQARDINLKKTYIKTLEDQLSVKEKENNNE